ncbi:MAG: hypothetical protein ACLQAT_26090 [Candidatus Binataceae bacterium]
MPLITPETVKRTLKDIYGYDISDDAAGAVANTAGSMLSLAQHLGTLGLEGIELPFGYATLMTEAMRTAAKK